MSFKKVLIVKIKYNKTTLFIVWNFSYSYIFVYCEGFIDVPFEIITYSDEAVLGRKTIYKFNQRGSGAWFNFCYSKQIMSFILIVRSFPYKCSVWRNQRLNSPIIYSSVTIANYNGSFHINSLKQNVDLANKIWDNSVNVMLFSNSLLW